MKSTIQNLKMVRIVMALILSSLLLVDCKKKNDAIPEKVENPTETYDVPNLYIGVVGFNDNVRFMGSQNRHFYPVSSSSDIEYFISNLNMSNGTLLYYSVDSALNLLKSVQFPDDVDNVSLITFTDGLDQGSGVLNPNYTSASEYLDALSNKIRSTRVNGKTINAYSIGIVGNDVIDKNQFVANLNKLASNPQNVTEVSDMTAVQNRFKKLAYEIKSILQNETTLQITTPYNGTKIRFTFDDVKNASSSSSYIEGIYTNNALTDIKYVGCSAANGSYIAAQKNGIHSSLSFVSLKGLLDVDVEPSMVQQWEYIPSMSNWQVNSEFEQKFDLTYSKTSVVMLVLDCSSSLSDKFPYMKQSVVEFLNILNGTFTGDSSQGGEDQQGGVTFENGVVQAAFSVSESKQVFFSQGNLQYQASTGMWRFAEHQWDYVGNSEKGTVYENNVKCDNANISSTYKGWIDLFSYGTSGWNNGAKAYQPYSISYSESPWNDFYNGNLLDEYAEADWGVYNAITNGGNQTGLWRTLTFDEWSYLISERTDATSKYGIACVNGVNGLILLPDSWKLPSGLTFKSGTAGSSGSDNYKTVNSFTAGEWAKMEANGAVFLPAAGYRTEKRLWEVDFEGGYWSSSIIDGTYGLTTSCLDIHGNNVGVYETTNSAGQSVRLVQDVE